MPNQGVSKGCYKTTDTIMTKKLMLSFMGLLGCTLGLFAQSSQMATLTHGTTTTSYYGETALSQAYDAATHGDVITLTGGTFPAVNIEKAITLRGNGAIGDANNGTLATVISGNFNINIPSGTAYVTKIEGLSHCTNQSIYINGNDGTDKIIILKSVLWNVICEKCSPNFLQSNISSLMLGSNPCNIYALNCIIGDLYGGEDATSFELDHCTITSALRIGSVVYKNCVIKLGGYYNSYFIQPSSSCDYCVGFLSGSYDNIFEYIISTTCVDLSANKGALFEDGNSYGTTCDYRLSETAATTYLGDDGTQVGAYGGNTPYNLTPTNPRISTFSVSVTNNNNTLNVRLNVQ